MSIENEKRDKYIDKFKEIEIQLRKFVNTGKISKIDN